MEIVLKINPEKYKTNKRIKNKHIKLKVVPHTTSIIFDILKDIDELPPIIRNVININNNKETKIILKQNI